MRNWIWLLISSGTVLVGMVAPTAAVAAPGASACGRSGGQTTAQLARTEQPLGALASVAARNHLTAEVTRAELFECTT